MMNKFRALMWFDAIATIFGAFMCIATPSTFVSTYFTGPVEPQTAPFVRWLGLMFAVCAAVVIRGLVVGDRAFWRTVLPAIVLGDAMHLAGSVWRATDPHFDLSAGSAGDLVLVLIYLPLRIWLAIHPERLDRDSG